MRLALRSIANTIGCARKQNFSGQWILQTVIGPVRVALIVDLSRTINTGQLPWLEYIRLIEGTVPLPRGTPHLAKRLCSDVVQRHHALLDSLLARYAAVDDLSLAKLFVHLAVASNVRAVDDEHWFNWQKQQFLSTRYFYLRKNEDTRQVEQNLSREVSSYVLQNANAPFPPHGLQSITSSGKIAVYGFDSSEQRPEGMGQRSSSLTDRMRLVVQQHGAEHV